VTPVNCVCGAEPLIRRSDSGVGIWCHSCGWEGPHLDTEAEAVEAWNRVMRPRPMVTVTSEDTGWTHFSIPDVASFIIGDEHAPEQLELLTAAGFEVRESEGK
jgi:hypothetical protein